MVGSFTRIIKTSTFHPKVKKYRDFVLMYLYTILQCPLKKKEEKNKFQQFMPLNFSAPTEAPGIWFISPLKLFHPSQSGGSSWCSVCLDQAELLWTNLLFVYWIWELTVYPLVKTLEHFYFFKNLFLCFMFSIWD